MYENLENVISTKKVKCLDVKYTMQIVQLAPVHIQQFEPLIPWQVYANNGPD